jgi:hypothetical protein
MHALKILELAHYVEHLQDENDELRNLMAWLSGHEPKLRMIIEAFKRHDGEGLGANMVGEGSGENIPEPPKTRHKSDFPPKPNHLRNRLDTTLAPPVFPTPTNDLQKPIKFVSTSGKVFFGKESEKASEGKLVEELSGEKPSEKPQAKPKPKLVRFHCVYCGSDGHKDEFCFKRKREERMAKDWANKDKYHPSDGVLEYRVQMPRAKASVRTVRAWGERKVVGGDVVQSTPVRPVLAWTGSSLGFVLVQGRGLFLEVVVLVVGLESLQVVRWLGILPLEFYGDGRSRSFEKERRDVPWAFFRGFGPPPGREGWFPQGGYCGGARGGSFGRREALVGANPTFEQMARHWFYSFGTSPSAESFFHSRARFLILGGKLEEHLVD